MIGWMANYKVGSRIFAGFGLILVLLAGLAFTGWRSLSGAAERSSLYAHYAGQVADIKEIETTVANMRRGVRIYGVAGDEAALKDSRQLAASLQKQLRAVLETHRSEKRREAMSRAIALADDYIGRIDVMVEARKERIQAEALMGQVGQAGIDEQDKAAALFKAAKEWERAVEVDDIQTEWMVARLRANQYLAHPGKEGAEVARRAMAKARQAIDAFVVKLGPGDALAIMKACAAQAVQYDKSFAAAVDAVSKSDDLVNVSLPKLAAEFALILGDLSKDLSQAIKLLTVENQAANDAATLLVLAVTAVALLLGVVFAWAIARGITVPVKDMTDTMTRLAGGDNSVMVPALGNKDEIGEMA